MYSKIRLSFLLISLSLLAVVGCQTQSDTCKVRIGLIPTEDNTLFYVADQENLFAQASLDVTFIDFASAQERDAALQAKQIDGEITDLMTVALQKKSGVDISILCLCLGAKPEEGPFSLIAAPNSGITAPSDLAGAEIGISQNTIIEYVTSRLLDSAGIAPANRNFVSVNKIPDRLNMVLENTLDVGVFPEPLASYAVSQGGIRVLDDTQQGFSQTVFFLTDQILTAWPNEVKTFMQVLAQAHDLYATDPEKYRTLITQRVKVPASMTETYTLPVFSPLQTPLEANYTDVMNWLVEKGVLTQPYTYTDLVNGSFLPEAQQ